MLRIRFTPDDLARTRLATEARPLVELMASFRLLRNGTASLGYGGWRRRTLPRLAADATMSTIAPLFDLIDANAYCPDFLLPLDGEATFDAELDRVLGTRRTRLRRELEQLAAARRQQPAWLRTLDHGGADSLQTLGAALAAYFEVALAPYWSGLAAHVRAERDRLRRTMADGGVDDMLAGLHPHIRWLPPVLEVACPWEYDLALRGGGLLVVPTFFRGPLPLFVDDPDLPTVLFVQIPVRETTWLEHAAGGVDGPGSAALATLLGDTRAAVLEAIAERPTSTEIARRLGLSAATTSWHVAALRAARLVTTRRNRYAVHALTPLGAALIDGGVPVRSGSNSLPDGARAASL